MAGRSSRPLRVLAYADSAIYSGAESLFSEVVSGLADVGDFEISAAVPSANSRLADELTSASEAKPPIAVPAQPLPLAAFWIHDPRRTAAVKRALSGVGADVVLLNLPSAEYGVTPLVVGQPAGVPTVGLLHISGTMADLDFRLGRTRTAIAARALRGLDRVCLLSESSSRKFNDDWRAGSVARDIFRPSVPALEKRNPAEARRKLRLPEEASILGIAGRLTARQKGHDTLIKAAPSVLARHPEVRFAVAGEGRDREKLEAMCRRRGLTDHFFFLGQIADIDSFLSAVDLIVIPSRFEGLPLVALESIQMGVPGIASAVDGLCDVWPEPWLVPAGYPDQLAHSLIDLLEADDDWTQELLESAREMMKSKFANSAAEDVAASLRMAVRRD